MSYLHVLHNFAGLKMKEKKAHVEQKVLAKVKEKSLIVKVKKQ